MRKNRLWVLPLALFFTACAGQSIAQEVESNGTTDSKKCKGEPQAPMVTLNVKSMKAEPECVRAYLGTTIMFRLTPKKDLDEVNVEIVPKDSFDEWLAGKNDLFDDIIVIRVPGKHVEKPEYQPTEHDYGIRVGDKYVDPRIQVEH